MALDKLVEDIFEDRIFQILLKSYPVGKYLGVTKKMCHKMKENKTFLLNFSLLREISHFGDFSSYHRVIIVVVVVINIY